MKGVTNSRAPIIVNTPKIHRDTFVPLLIDDGAVTNVKHARIGRSKIAIQIKLAAVKESEKKIGTKRSKQRTEKW
jgi:hypothetical protein